MAVMNNPVVGTEHCKVCSTVASFHETKRGRGKGRLYRRCECGCDQRTGAVIQKQWRQSMTPRPGFEHLAEPKPEPKPEPETTEPVPEPTTEPEPIPAPDMSEKATGSNTPKETEPAPKNRTGPGAGQLFALCLGVGLTLLTLGRGGPGV